MKRILLSLSFIICHLSFSVAQVSFSVSDGIDNEAIKSKIESTVSRMLTEINAAQEAGRSLNFSAMGNIGTRVQQSMAMLWENSPFVCTDEEIIEHCLTTGFGYQVRNIPLMMKPTGEREFAEDEYQEAVISFDKQGNVESFYLSISMNLYMNVIKSNLELTDLRRRQLILDYVEQFRTAYNQKDINFLNQVFSDDALIITGKVIQQKHAEGFSTQKIMYYKQGKEEYLTKLRGVFKRNNYIKVNFDSIEVRRHPDSKKTDYYGVTLKQRWRSGEYSDEGYVFLLWDFKDENAPQVHVRTWQPSTFDKKPLPKEDIFSLSDFNIK